MIARFIHDGDSIDYTPSSAVNAGDVVLLTELLGIAKVDIPANTLGALATKGVYEVPKKTGPDTTWPLGVTVFWDAANKQVTDQSSGNQPFGFLLEAVTDTDTIARVLLNQ